jgi:hypothetical protein
VPRDIYRRVRGYCLDQSAQLLGQNLPLGVVIIGEGRDWHAFCTGGKKRSAQVGLNCCDDVPQVGVEVGFDIEPDKQIEAGRDRPSSILRNLSGVASGVKDSGAAIRSKAFGTAT